MQWRDRKFAQAQIHILYCMAKPGLIDGLVEALKAIRLVDSFSVT